MRLFNTELIYNKIMSNVFNKAYEIAADLTSEWYKTQEHRYVSEQEVAAIFKVFYEEALMNTKIDVLNF